MRNQQRKKISQELVRYIKAEKIPIKGCIISDTDTDNSLHHI